MGEARLQWRLASGALLGGGPGLRGCGSAVVRWSVRHGGGGTGQRGESPVRARRWQSNGGGARATIAVSSGGEDVVVSGYVKVHPVPRSMGG